MLKVSHLGTCNGYYWLEMNGQHLEDYEIVQGYGESAALLDILQGYMGDYAEDPKTGQCYDTWTNLDTETALNIQSQMGV